MARRQTTVDSGDFSLMDRSVVDQLVRLPERNRYVRGLRAWVGFRQIGVEYERDERRAGRTKYSLRQLLRLAYDGIFAFSDAPLRVARDMGLLITAGAALLGGWTLFKRLTDAVAWPIVPKRPRISRPVTEAAIVVARVPGSCVSGFWVFGARDGRSTVLLGRWPLQARLSG